MWPSHLSVAFGSVACPLDTQCELPYCIFSHKSSIQEPGAFISSGIRGATETEPSAKRRKTEYSGYLPVRHETHDQSKSPSKPVFFGSICSDASAIDADSSQNIDGTVLDVANDSTLALPRSAVRPVSPPSSTRAKVIPKVEGVATLLPRKLVKEPTTFAKRWTFLKALHAYMKPQNDRLLRATKPEVKALYLDSDQLIRLAVGEEERIARENPFVYENLVKQRLVNLKALTPETWVKERREALARETGTTQKVKPSKRVDTGLKAEDESILISMLECPQQKLDIHGYVIRLPTMEELSEARLTQEAAGFWEVCDRCATRFQVFPQRREEDGALTTGGQCRHHWGKRVFAKKGKGMATETTKMSCCNESIGSPGCTLHETHVFKIIGANALSLVMPFVETPANDAAKEHSAVCFDCEMGYTTMGLELLRLTAIAWPTHKPLIDVLVRPLGHLLDVNTRFSGVTPEQFLRAKPFDKANPKPVRTDLRIVDSPYVARELFLELINPEMPVLGHAIENDLNTIRLVHPVIVDTVLLYPTRRGLPSRHGLRQLAKMHLGEDIQQAGAAGHDSYEDARTTGELVRLRIKEKWKALKADGWQIRDHELLPPTPNEEPPVDTSTPLSEVLTLGSTRLVELDKKRKIDTTFDV